MPAYIRGPIFYLVVGVLLLSLAPLATSQTDTFRPVVRGKRGVVTGGSPLSVEAGLRILRQGGNATDAGVATILAASVIEFSHFSFGGEVPILIKLKGKDVAVVEGMGTAPAKATREFFVKRAEGSGKPAVVPGTGPLGATVPAVLDACVTALDQFGTKSLAEVMQPAIELADGFPIDELRVKYIQTRSAVFSQWPDAKRLFLPNGQTPKPGDMFVQADLARTLREIVKAEAIGVEQSQPAKNSQEIRHTGLTAARDYFYRGPIGKRIGEYMQTHGGLLAAEDLAGWHAGVGVPVKRTIAATKSTRQGSGRRDRRWWKRSICSRVTTSRRWATTPRPTFTQ